MESEDTNNIAKEIFRKQFSLFLFAAVTSLLPFRWCLTFLMQRGVSPGVFLNILSTCLNKKRRYGEVIQALDSWEDWSSSGTVMQLSHLVNKTTTKNRQPTQTVAVLDELIRLDHVSYLYKTRSYFKIVINAFCNGDASVYSWKMQQSVMLQCARVIDGHKYEVKLIKCSIFYF